MITFLNSAEGKYLSGKLALSDEKLNDEMESANFWMGGNMEVKEISCTGVVAKGIRFSTVCKLKGKQVEREAFALFPSEISDETCLKLRLLDMCQQHSGRSKVSSYLKMHFLYVVWALLETS